MPALVPETAGAVGLAWWQWVIISLWPVASIAGHFVAVVAGRERSAAKDATIETLKERVNLEHRMSAAQLIPEIERFKTLYQEAQDQKLLADEKFDEARISLTSAESKVRSLEQEIASLKRKIEMVVRGPGVGGTVEALLGEISTSAQTFTNTSTELLSEIGSAIKDTNEAGVFYRAIPYKLDPATWQAAADAWYQGDRGTYNKIFTAFRRQWELPEVQEDTGGPDV